MWSPFLRERDDKKRKVSGKKSGIFLFIVDFYVEICYYKINNKLYNDLRKRLL